MYSLKVGRWTRNGRLTYLTLSFDENGLDPKDAQKWARAVAGDWGEINTQKKVQAKGIPGPAWWFSCSGHGGYIMVARKGTFPKELEKFAVEGYPCWTSEPPPYANYAVLAFEEDCNWAVFQLLYPPDKKWTEKHFIKPPSRDYIKGVIKRYQPPEIQELLSKAG